MEPEETELDDALIDAFDAEPAPPRRRVEAGETFRRKSPSFDSLKHADTIAETARRPHDIALRHYPSLDALESPLSKPYVPYVPSYTPTAAPTPSPAVAPAVQYPRLEPIAVPAQAVGKEPPPLKVLTTKAEHVENERVQGQVATPEQSRVEVVTKDLETEVLDPSVEDGDESRDSVPLEKHQSIPTDEEIEAQRRQLQAQVALFEQQARYMALALAGETPHQIEMRRLREEERKEREEKRLAAVESRMEHMIEREQQREARMAERRQRHMERSHRSSVSPSPERKQIDETIHAEAVPPPTPLI